jgi:hypothetical protein
MNTIVRYCLLLICLLGINMRSDAQITTYPHLNTVESESNCGTSCSSSCVLTGTWKNAVDQGLPPAGTRWLSEDGSTPSSDTGPDLDHTSGTPSGKYLYVETSGCNNITADLVSDVFDFTNLSNPSFDFWYHMYGATMGTMQIDVSVDGGMNFNQVEAPFTDNENVWQFKRVSLIAYGGMPNVRIRIRAVTGTSFTSDMAIDDLLVYDCAVPSIIPVNISLVSENCKFKNNEQVSIEMKNNGCLAIEAGATLNLGYTLNNGSQVNATLVTSNAILPNELITYNFPNTINLASSFEAILDGFVYFPASNQDTLRLSDTLYSGVNTFPYFEDFEAGNGGWLKTTLGSFSSWELGTPVKSTINSAHSGVNAWITGTTNFYSDLEHGAIVSPCFDFRNLTAAQFSMWIWWNCEFSWDGAVLQSSIDEGQSWQNVGEFGDPNNWYTDNTIVGAPGGSMVGWSGRASTSNGSGGWVLASHDISHLDNLPQVYLRIAFGTDGSVTDDGFAFDDISITGNFTGLPEGWIANENGINCPEGSNGTYDDETETFILESINCNTTSPFTSDDLAFFQHSLCGDGSLTVQVTGIVGSNAWAGITMRETNDPGSKKVQLSTNLTSNITRKEIRTITNGSAIPQQSPSLNRHWLRLTRQGNQFTGHISPNGQQWFLSFTVNISMGSCIEAGMVMNNVSSNSTATGYFRNVQITQNNPNPTYEVPGSNIAQAQRNEKEITIYPNPFREELNVSLPDAYFGKQIKIELYNMQGQVMMEKNINESLKSESLNISQFPSGVYLLRIESNGFPDVLKRAIKMEND